MFHVPVLRDISTITYSKRSHNGAFPVAALWQPLKSQHILLYFQITSGVVATIWATGITSVSATCPGLPQLCHLVPEIRMRVHSGSPASLG